MFAVYREEQVYDGETAPVAPDSEPGYYAIICSEDYIGLKERGVVRVDLVPNGSVQLTVVQVGDHAKAQWSLPGVLVTPEDLHGAVTALENRRGLA